MIYFLFGVWHLHYSTFPMWHKEGISDVTFNYSQSPKVKDKMKDEVKYLHHQKHKSIVGVDRHDEDKENSFIWRGTGLLSLITSKWRIEWVNETKDCIVISFEKTLFTPAGIDILSKDGIATPAILQEALTVVRAKNLLHNVKEKLLLIP